MAPDRFRVRFLPPRRCFLDVGELSSARLPPSGLRLVASPDLSLARPSGGSRGSCQAMARQCFAAVALSFLLVSSPQTGSAASLFYPTALGGGPVPNFLEATDINGDGHLDAIVSNGG